MNKLSSYVIATAFVAVLSVAALAPSAVSAQERTGLSVSPPTFEFSANPGNSVSNTVRVENVTDEALEVSVDKRNFTALGEEGQVDLSDEDSSFSLSSWMTVSPERTTIGPKQSQTFEYSIDVPGNAEPGGRFGSIVFKTTPKPVTGSSGVAVGQEVGALVFMRIAGEVEEKAKIESFKANNFIYENGPVQFEARVRNLGNVHFKPTGTITITNMFGDVVKTIAVDSRNVLPDAVRKMNGEWNNKWVLGPHTATVSLVYGSDGKIMTASTNFWGIPYKIIIAIVAVLLVIGFLLYLGRGRLKKSLKVLFGKE